MNGSLECRDYSSRRKVKATAGGRSKFVIGVADRHLFLHHEVTSLCQPKMRATGTTWASILTVVTAVLLSALFYSTALYAPLAQPEAGGLAQKIFYFHVPAAYAMYLCGVVCCIASATYLVRPTDRINAWARAAAECAVVFGLVVLTSGPLWAKKAWGIYWTWDPRLTTLLLSVLIYAAVVVLRVFAGDGDAERRFAAALGVLGTVNLPIIHLSVRKWGGNHPTVISRGGGGISPDMRTVLSLGFYSVTVLALLLLWIRARNALLNDRLRKLEDELALVDGTSS
jgi:heme exporter protein C